MAVLEHILGGTLPLHRRISVEFAEREVSDTSAQILGGWDAARDRERERSTTELGKKRKAEKKARKARLLQRQALRSGAYMYTTCEEQAVKIEAQLEGDSGSETETDAEIPTHLSSAHTLYPM